jgi:hypothetical protein
MAGFNKSNIAVFNERVFIVTEMLLSGLKRREIIQNIAENDKLKWNVSERQIDNYIENANVHILALLEDDKQVLKKKVFAKYDFIYKKLLNVKDYKGALIALEKIANLTGINDPTKIAATTKDGEDVTPYKITLNLT